MKNDRPSTTARRVALARAAHQAIDPAPRVFDDPLALGILGEQAQSFQAGGWRHRASFARRMRAFVVARSRVAEDELAAAVARGARQYVVLGAGLDTYAWRNTDPALHVFEVDHPATQAWKRRLLAGAGLAVPGTARLVPVDFERQSWLEQLEAAGFSREVPTHFSLLGVAMYLSPAQIDETLAAIASLPAASSLVMDYLVPASQLDPALRAVLGVLSLLVSLVGEPLKSHFTPQQMHALLSAHGFTRVDDLGPEDLNARFFGGRTEGFAVGALGRVACAAR